MLVVISYKPVIVLSLVIILSKVAQSEEVYAANTSYLRTGGVTAKAVGANARAARPRDSRLEICMVVLLRISRDG